MLQKLVDLTEQILTLTKEVRAYAAKAQADYEQQSEGATRRPTGSRRR
jgi:hypothetical protein